MFSLTFSEVPALSVINLVKIFDGLDCMALAIFKGMV